MKIANKQTNLFRIPPATVNFCETKCCFCNIVLGNLVCCSFLSASLSRIGLVANTAGFIARCSDLDWFLPWIVVQTPIFTTRQSTRFTPKKKPNAPFQHGEVCPAQIMLCYNWSQLFVISDQDCSIFRPSDFWIGRCIKNIEHCPPENSNHWKKGLIPKHPVLLTTGFLLFLVYINLHFPLLLMKEILHQLMLVSHYLRGFIHPGCRRIPSINTSNWGGGSNFTTFRWLIHSQHLFPPWEW